MLVLTVRGCKVQVRPALVCRPPWRRSWSQGCLIRLPCIMQEASAEGDRLRCSRASVPSLSLDFARHAHLTSIAGVLRRGTMSEFALLSGADRPIGSAVSADEVAAICAACSWRRQCLDHAGWTAAECAERHQPRPFPQHHNIYAGFWSRLGETPIGCSLSFTRFEVAAGAGSKSTHSLDCRRLSAREHRRSMPYPASDAFQAIAIWPQSSGRQIA